MSSIRALKSNTTHSQVSFWRLSQRRLWFSVPNKDTLTGLQTCNLVTGRTLHVVWVINVSFNAEMLSVRWWNCICVGRLGEGWVRRRALNLKKKKKRIIIFKNVKRVSCSFLNYYSQIHLCILLHFWFQGELNTETLFEGNNSHNNSVQLPCVLLFNKYKTYYAQHCLLYSH